MKKFFEMLLFVVAEILIFRLIAIEYSKYYFHHNKHLIKPEHDCQCECGKWEEKYEEEQKNRMHFEDDIQDNEFVDPEINKMLDRHSLQDSGVSHKESKLKNSSLKYKKRR